LATDATYRRYGSHDKECAFGYRERTGLPTSAGHAVFVDGGFAR
jgi:hypothetical protein